MLEHQKLIIRNLSFDKNLFRKELIKSVEWLSPTEFTELKKWVFSNYSESHGEVISKLW